MEFDYGPWYMHLVCKVTECDATLHDSVRGRCPFISVTGPVTRPSDTARVLE